MDLELRGKTALVTGASYGLGYACAKVLASEGVMVAINSSNAKKIEAAAREIASNQGAKVSAIAADLKSEEELQSLAQQAMKQLGKIDILVVSTGHPATFPFSKASDENWKDGIDLLLRPPIVLTRAVLEGMKSRKFGRIIFIGSIFGLEPERTSVVQSTLRTGLNALAKCVASEVAGDGVTVNVICPGYFDTPLVRSLAQKYAHEKNLSVESVLEEWAEYAPVKRFGKPDDLGALVAFLCSPKSEFITGTAITIDGGAIRQY